MDFTEEKTLSSSEKSKVVLGTSEGKQYIKKTGEFSRETVSTILSVNSPYIAKICEVGEDYLITEYADGFALSERKIPPKDVFNVAVELCDALAALHKEGIIYRDVKPSNIILCGGLHIKLIDFDTARLKKPDMDRDTRFIGTEGFAPPEQYGFMQTDERSDIYAFGITIRTLLDENYSRSAYKHVIEKCIKFNPDQRYQSMKAVKAALLISRITPYIFAAVGAAAIIVTASATVNRPDPPVSDEFYLHSFSSSSIPASVISKSSFYSSSTPASSFSSSEIPASVTSESSLSVSSSADLNSSSETEISSSNIPEISSSSAPKSSSSNIPQNSSSSIQKSSSSSASKSSSSSAPKSSSSSAPKSSSSSASKSSSSSAPKTSSSSVPKSSSSNIPQSSSSSAPQSSSSVNSYKPITPENQPVTTAQGFPLDWEHLTLPDGFPKLTNAVTAFEFKNKTEEPYKCRYVINWQELSLSEINEILFKLEKTFSNGSFTSYDQHQYQNDDIFWNLKCRDYNIYFQPNVTSGGWFLYILSNANYSINSKHADPAPTTNADRFIKWEEKDVPNELPKLSDYITSCGDSGDRYSIYWDTIRFEEMESIVKKIADAFDDGYYVSCQFQPEYYYWEFTGTLNGAKRMVTSYFIYRNDDTAYNTVDVIRK